MAGGGYSMGFTITPLDECGGLDMTGDFKGGPHPANEDNLYKLALKNRDAGNTMVKEGKYEAAVAKYSELIMQLRGLSEETDVVWNDKDEEAVRQLRAAAYLNLSLCFLKMQSWQHALNTSTRALQGDKDPVDPKENVLAPEKKAKALFRRAQAQSTGFDNHDKAVVDLQKALEYTPEDKAVQQELRRVQQILAKTEKAADKKLAGFFANSKKAASGEGLFDKKLTSDQKNEGNEPKLTDIKKLSDGLWLAPKNETEKAAEEEQEGGEDQVDYEELSREINEMREDRPEVYAELRTKIETHLKEAAEDAQKDESAAEPPAVAA